MLHKKVTKSTKKGQMFLRKGAECDKAVQQNQKTIKTKLIHCDFVCLILP